MALKKINMLLALLPLLLAAGCGADREAPAPAAPAAAETLDVGGLVPVRAVQAEEGASLLVVPAAAVFHEGAMAGVLVVGEDGRIAVRWISTGHAIGAGLIVLAGLDAGELVVGSYDPALRNGIKVTKSQAVTEEVQSK
ncbi:hypothetical protein [Chlorobium sp. N1]|uniref:hypothetical protein n=1 Tax=Chlorobium sp. N1 TaxID=2491138 RepID=UPI0010400497|nr:hypothetical protein [Chlorobium sp. N1]TCD48067.1 hypothetical protein E0L29_04045 [Chlorobium sp. N1]